MLRLVARRRVTLSSRLAAASAEPGAKRQPWAAYLRTRNRPPCGVFVKPFPLPCLRLGCPFRHGRSVAEDFSEVAAVIAAFRRQGVPCQTLISIRESFSPDATSAAATRRAFGKDRGRLSIVPGVGRFRRHVIGVPGAGVLVRGFADPRADGSVILRTVRVVIADPQANLTGVPGVALLDSVDPEVAGLASAFAVACRYPAGLLDRTEPASDLLAAMRGVRTTWRAGLLHSRITGCARMLSDADPLRRRERRKLRDSGFAEGGGI